MVVMKRYKIQIVLILLLIVPGSCYNKVEIFNAEPSELLELSSIKKLDGKECGFDYNLNLLRYPIHADSIFSFSPLVEFKQNARVSFNGITLQNNKTNEFCEIVVGKNYQLEIELDNTQYSLELVFTNLPVVSVVCDSPIYDEPKTLARVSLNNPLKTQVFSSFVGIEIRGKHSRDYPKQSMGFELWEGMVNKNEFSAALLGQGKSSNWILNGAVIDPARIRNSASFQIWNRLKNAENIGINTELVELFYNHEFRGLYIFSENINREFLNAPPEAVLYKGVDWADGATRFEKYDSKLSQNQFWNGWEQKIPEENEQINWEPLAELYELLIHGNDEQFISEIGTLIDLNNFVDYYLFLNLMNAQDNTGKNVFLYKKSSGAKFQIIPWDLDGAWGIIFNGARTEPTGILGNNLFDRLITLNPNNFKKELKERWAFLRQNNFDYDNLNWVFDQWFNRLSATDIIQKENQIWNIELSIRAEQQYIKDWTAARLEYLDIYFEKL